MNRSILFFLRAYSRHIYLPVAIMFTFSVCALAEPVESTVSQEQQEAIKGEATKLSSPIVPKIQSKNNTENTNNHTENPEQVTYETNTSWWSLTLADSLSVLFTCLVAIFTGFLAHTTKKMWRATKQSASAAEKSANAAEIAANIALKAERARIIISDFALEDASNTTTALTRAANKPNAFSLNFQIENQGRSSGREVKYIINVAIDENFVDTVNPEEMKSIKHIRRFEKEIRVPIAPHNKSIYKSQDFTFPVISEDLTLPADVWNNTKSFKTHLFLYGSVTYVDNFDEFHESPFGYMFIYREIGKTTTKSEFIPLSHSDFWHYT